MRARFSVAFKIDFPKVTTKEGMMKIVQMLVGDINEHLDEDITDIELLLHTLIIYG